MGRFSDRRERQKSANSGHSAQLEMAGSCQSQPPLALFYEYGILGSCRPCTQSLATLTHSG